MKVDQEVAFDNEALRYIYDLVMNS